MIELAFNPHQPRDETGKWSKVGSGSGKSKSKSKKGKKSIKIHAVGKSSTSSISSIPSHQKITESASQKENRAKEFEAREKRFKRYLNEAKKVNKETKEYHSGKQIAKDVTASILLERAYHTVKPKVKSAAVKAAKFANEKFGKKVVKETAQKTIHEAIGSGAKKAITKRPGWKVLAEAGKKVLNHPIVKKTVEALIKSGKFAAKVALAAAPYLMRTAAAIGVFFTTATLPELIIIGSIAAATAYAVYKVHQHIKEKRRRRAIEEIFKKYGLQYQA